MTIQLIGANVIGGTSYRDGQQLTLSAATEIRIVAVGAASRVGAPVDLSSTPLKVVRLSRSTDQPFTKGGVKTILSWDAADFDTTGGAWTIDNPTKFIVPAGYSWARLAGQFLVSNAPVNQNIVGHIQTNGSTTVPGMGLISCLRGGVAGGLDVPSQQEWIPVTPGEFFELYSINVDPSNDYTIAGTGRTWFFMELR